MDLVLSSGFLAFASHAGVLCAIEERGLAIDAVCGTSSGALVGGLWVAGMPAREILQRLDLRPLAMTRLHLAPWRGALSLRALVEDLARDLPPTFADLTRSFGVGVVEEGTHQLLTEGPLPVAVAASCAVPYLFAPVRIGTRWYQDGGARDRLALEAWSVFRAGRRRLVHLVQRSHGAQSTTDLTGCVVVRSPRAQASLWSLGDTAARFERARGETHRVLDGTREAAT